MARSFSGGVTTLTPKHPSTGPGLVGRAAERRLLAAMIAGLPDRGGAVFVRGEAGIGKTALLADAVLSAPSTVRRVWVNGTESEVVLPFAAIADLLRPLLGHVDHLCEAQRSALRVALALENGPTPSPLAVCAAVLGVLAAAGACEPLLVVVDDFQWIDPPSQQVLSFVGRRLASEPVVLLLAARRRVVPSSAGISDLWLDGLSIADCTAMLRGRGIAVPPGALALIVDQSDGNPLAVIESTAHAGRRHHPAARLDVVEAEPTIAAAWGAELDRLPEATGRALFVVAAARTPDLGALVPALNALDLSVDDLAAAEQSDLLRAGPTSVALRHPLLRSVIVHRTPLNVRLATYRAFAACTAGHERAWYLAAASHGPDNAVADLLVDAALDARQRSGFSASARTWCRAAEMTVDARQRAERLLQAAGDAHIAGESELALRWCDDALTGVQADPSLAADIELVRGRARAWLGHPRRAYTDLVRAAEAVTPFDVGRAARLYAEAATPCAMDAESAEMHRVAQRCAELGEGDEKATLRALATLAPASVLFGATDNARRLLERVPSFAECGDAVMEIGDQLYALLVGQARVRIEQFDAARGAIGIVINETRRVGAAAALAVTIASRSELDWWTGLWASAHADASEALEWAVELRQIGVLGYCLSMLARLEAVRGETATALARLDRAHAEVGPYGIGCMEFYLPSVAGLIALTGGDWETATESLEPAWRKAIATQLGSTNAVPFVPDLIEAHIRAGNRDRAHELLQWWQERATESSLLFPATTAARLCGMLADDADAAEEQFVLALEIQNRCAMPFERARTLLCAAESLRRARRPAAARPVLREALGIFRSLDARPWAERAERELVAAGARVETQDGPAPWADTLTPQEFQVARAIATGLSNTEVAATLFVSAKTVEGHLTRIYRKLGVRSRTELTRTLLPMNTGGRPP